MSEAEDREPIVVPPARRQRRAWVCFNKDGTIHRRVFLLPGESETPKPKCHDHGPMVRQVNTVYMAGRNGRP